MHEITKHEWVNTSWGELTCTICKAKMIHDLKEGTKEYFNQFGVRLLTEPPCFNYQMDGWHKCRQ